MRRKNPCYPQCTGDGRSADCHATCKKWAEYEAEKFADYAVRNERLALKEDLNEHTKAATKRMKRGKRKTE